MENNEQAEADLERMIRTGSFQYVMHRKVDEYHRKGWMIVSDLGPHHGFYSVLMWRCDCENVEGSNVRGSNVESKNDRTNANHSG